MRGLSRSWSVTSGSFGDFRAGCEPHLPEELLPFLYVTRDIGKPSLHSLNSPPLSSKVFVDENVSGKGRISSPTCMLQGIECICHLHADHQSPASSQPAPESLACTYGSGISLECTRGSSAAATDYSSFHWPVTGPKAAETQLNCRRPTLQNTADPHPGVCM